jgi:hypothetical protein
MSFKKFFQFILEKKKPSDKDIEEIEAPKPDSPAEPLSCPKCGSSRLPCECYTDDYYDAKKSHQTPRPSTTIKPKNKKMS